MMRTELKFVLVAALLSIPAFAQNTARSGSDQTTIIRLGQKAAIAALNFQQGDTFGFGRAREDFTTEGWKNFVKSMQGFLDENGAPTFTSSFVAARDATVVDEKEGVLHLRIPGTLTQSSKLGRTTYKAALEVYLLPNRAPDGKPVKIQRLDQITCGGSSTACQ